MSWKKASNSYSEYTHEYRAHTHNTFRFVKDLVSRSGFGDDSSIMNLIKYIKETEISDFNKRLINLINMNVEGSSNIQHEKLPDEKNKIKSNDTFSSYSYYSKYYVNNTIQYLSII